MNTIKVAVTGACGRMGQEVVRMVLNDPELTLAAAIDRGNIGQDIGELTGKGSCGIHIQEDLESVLRSTKPDVMVDFTVPKAAVQNTEIAITNGVRPVVGTTGFTPEHIRDLDMLCRDHQVGGIIAPNFSIGVILMMRFAAQAAKYYPHLEIIEYHGDQKLDAPSGTAVKTAEMISQVRKSFHQGNPQEEETIPGARGGNYDGFRIHSVRLPGVFAQQEVIFGGFGESFKIRADSYERASYMPGVNIAVKKVMNIKGIVYGFEHFID